MRHSRLLAPDSFAHALYHCISRVVDKRMIFQKAEKEKFVAIMRMYERLCGVRVLTHCVMGNHFHLLVEVPKRPLVLPTQENKEYRWCGYGEAVAGQTPAAASLARMAELSSPSLAQGKSREAVWKADILCWYRQGLCVRGEQTHDARGAVIRKGLSAEQVQAVRDAKGALPLHEYLRLRVRYFTCGLVLGSTHFVDSVLRERRTWFSKKRKDGARRLKGLDPSCPLRSARDLVVKPFG